MAWRLEFEGEVYREVDLTLDQVERIEEITKDSWLRIAPLKSAKHAKAILTVCHADRAGVSLDEAAKKVGAVKADDFVGMLSVEPLDEQLDLPTTYEDGVPKAEAGGATP